LKPTSGVVVANVHWKLNRCSSSAGAGRLEVTQGACSKLEHSADVRVSNLRQYLEALMGLDHSACVSEQNGSEPLAGQHSLPLGVEPYA